MRSDAGRSQGGVWSKSSGFEKGIRMDQEQKDLLLFQLGPVQEFIAQAEKIGDLRVG